MWARIIQMGLPSVILSLASVALDRSVYQTGGPFRNFDRGVLAVVLLQALGGLNVAFVLKYADNILKCFAAAFSSVTLCLLEIILFGFKPDLNFIVGAILINATAYLYNQKDSTSTNTTPSSSTTPTTKTLQQPPPV